MRLGAIACVWVLLACQAQSGDRAPEVPAPPAPVPDEPPMSIAPPAIEEVPLPWEGTIRSLKVRRSIAVRQAPDGESAPLGTVAQDMRVLWSRAANGPGCEGVWVEIQPRGWVCSAWLEPNFRPARLVELPRIPAGEVAPGVYGKVVGKRTRAFKSLADARRRKGGRALAGSTMIKFIKELQVGRRKFWRTNTGELVEARRILPREPSRHSGLELQSADSPVLPVAWVRNGEPAIVWSEPGGAVDLRQLAPRTVVSVLEESGDAWTRIGSGEWVESSRLRVARLSAPPPELAPGEKWIDVDLAEQVLVAYEGEWPVFATLVSTGDRNPTPTGTWRIWIKFSEREMRGEVNGRSYQVADVPWTMFFHGDFALHGAYWHDKFGERASSGCVNLAPIDARLLYRWADPEVPTGWTMAHARSESPGTLVRIRQGKADAIADAAHRCYAARVVPDGDALEAPGETQLWGLGADDWPDDWTAGLQAGSAPGTTVVR